MTENLSKDFEFEQVRATAEAAKIQADRATRGVRALEGSVRRHGRYAGGSVIAVLCLMIMGGVGGYFINAQLKAQGTSIAEALGLQFTIEKLNRRMSAAEVAVSTFPAELRNVMGRMDALDTKKGTKQPATVAAATPAASGPDVAQLNDRIAELQAQHSADTEQISSLRGELDSVKQDTSSQIAGVRSEIPADSTQDVASLRADAERDRARFAALVNRTDRSRSDFEVGQGQASEVVPGILMTIKTTDVGRQEVSGWLYLQHERRFVYLKNQGLLRPVTVYGSADNKVHDIIITRVKKDYAIGYVLSPKGEGEKQTVSASAGN